MRERPRRRCLYCGGRFRTNCSERLWCNREHEAAYYEHQRLEWEAQPLNQMRADFEAKRQVLMRGGTATGGGRVGFRLDMDGAVASGRMAG